MPLEWNELVDQFRDIGDRVVAKTWNKGTEISRQETYRWLMTAQAQAVLNMLHVDPDFPDWTPILNNVLNMAAPNPDFIYFYAFVDGRGTYKLSGYRGSNQFVYLSQSEAIYTVSDSPKPSNLGLDLDDIHMDEDGYFEILFSNDKPKGYDGNWWQLDPTSKHLSIRQAAYDWGVEEDARISITRLDGPVVPVRLTADEISDRLKMLATWMENALTHWFHHLNETREKGTINRLEIFDFGPQGGFEGQIYLEGIHQLEADEALILETEVPETCFYWSFLITDDQFSTIDYMNRQSSLNPSQIVLDNDGKFRAVISAQDPGVPNWLDSAGYPSGMIQGRWNNCSSSPTPTLKKVKVAEVRAHLPADTPMIDQEVRRAALEKRRTGYQLRRRW